MPLEAPVMMALMSGADCTGAADSPMFSTGRSNIRMARGVIMERMSAVTKSRVTEAEFLGLPESVERIELIDGEVIVSPSPQFWHQEVLGRLVFALRQWAEGRSGITI